MVEVLPSQRKVSAQLMMNIATKYPTDATVLQAVMHILASMLHEKGLTELHTLTHRLRRRDCRAQPEQLSRRVLLRTSDGLHHHTQQRALCAARPRRQQSECSLALTHRSTIHRLHKHRHTARQPVPRSLVLLQPHDHVPSASDRHDSLPLSLLFAQFVTISVIPEIGGGQSIPLPTYPTAPSQGNAHCSARGALSLDRGGFGYVTNRPDYGSRSAAPAGVGQRYRGVADHRLEQLHV